MDHDLVEVAARARRNAVSERTLGHRNEGVRLAGPVPLAVVFSSSWLPRGGVLCVLGAREIGLGSEVLGALGGG